MSRDALEFKITRHPSGDVLPFPRKQTLPHSRKLATRRAAPTEPDGRHGLVTAVATADSYKFRQLKRFFQPARGEILDSSDVAYVVFPAYGSEEETSVFFFPYGVTVWWGSEYVGRQVLSQLKPFEIKPEKEIDFERCTFAYGAGTSKIVSDTIFLENDSMELKLGFSFGFAQGAKLTVLEDRIESIICSTEKLPRNMGRGGSLTMTRGQAARLKGTLFIHRMNVNLNTDILVTPNFFWDRVELRSIYAEARRYMELDQRLAVLGQRLQIVDDLFAILHQELKTRHLRHLEWVVLCLVFVNVILAWVSLRNHLRSLPFLPFV
eukprot:RCo050774